MIDDFLDHLFFKRMYSTRGYTLGTIEFGSLFLHMRMRLPSNLCSVSPTSQRQAPSACAVWPSVWQSVRYVAHRYWEHKLTI